jgi:N6-L-threonylcarbamoyladenine synthase
MRILGIESSCDDTSVALLDSSDQGHFIIAEKTFSQIEIHQKYGGVVPEIAGRMHAEKIAPIIEEVLKGQPKPDVIAVTAGPGLITGLIVAVEAARTLGYAWNIPIVATNHISGHVHSVEIKKEKTSTPPSPISFPALALIVSGGHTELILMQSHTECTILGRTKDDAAGECFDKVASLLGFTYPGGPHISREAVNGNSHAIEFPRPMIHDRSYDFSFSGLKTAALYWLRDHSLAALPTGLSLPAGIFGTQPSEPTRADFCASFEQAIIDVLVTKTMRAAEEHKPKSIILGGGVSANKKLREALTVAVQTDLPETNIHLPPQGYSMDNGAMIAVAGYYQALNKNFTSWETLAANPNWRIDR